MIITDASAYSAFLLIYIVYSFCFTFILSVFIIYRLSWAKYTLIIYHSQEAIEQIYNFNLKQGIFNGGGGVIQQVWDWGLKMLHKLIYSFNIG